MQPSAQFTWALLSRAQASTRSRTVVTDGLSPMARMSPRRRSARSTETLEIARIKALNVWPLMPPWCRATCRVQISADQHQRTKAFVITTTTTTTTIIITDIVTVIVTRKNHHHHHHHHHCYHHNRNNNHNHRHHYHHILLLQHQQQQESPQYQHHP